MFKTNNNCMCLKYKIPRYKFGVTKIQHNAIIVTNSAQHPVNFT